MNAEPQSDMLSIVWRKMILAKLTGVKNQFPNSSELVEILVQTLNSIPRSCSLEASLHSLYVVLDQSPKSLIDFVKQVQEVPTTLRLSDAQPSDSVKLCQWIVAFFRSRSRDNASEFANSLHEFGRSLDYAGEEYLALEVFAEEMSFRTSCCVGDRNALEADLGECAYRFGSVLKKTGAELQTAGDALQNYARFAVDIVACLVASSNRLFFDGQCAEAQKRLDVAQCFTKCSKELAKLTSRASEIANRQSSTLPDVCGNEY